MERPALIFEYSPLFIVLCVLLGLAYAFLLYRKRGPWSSSVNKVLFAVRFLLVAILASLLVSPILKQVQNIVEPPAYVLAIDNSTSVVSDMDSTDISEYLKTIKKIASEKKKEGFEVEYRQLTGETTVPTQSSFNASSSDLAGLLQIITDDFEGRNLAGVALFSDGIYNEGISPTYKNYAYPVNTVGIGDTIPKTDIAITSLIYNKISYQGNKFPLVVQFVQQGFTDEKVNVSVTQNGKVIDAKTSSLKGSNQLNEVKFLIEAEKKGYQRYGVNITVKEGEFSRSNNSKQAYVEVIEGKEHIALIAAAPHPDIKALRSAIESNANYSFDQFIMSFQNDRQRLANITKKYDLVIFHHLPTRNLPQSVFENIKKQNPPIFYLFGAETDLQAFNIANKVLTLDLVPGEYDNVTAAFNQSFVNFKLSDDLQQTFTELPPINVPYGNMNIVEGTKVLLYQQVGSIVTTKPLIAINEDKEPKTAVMLGDGLWKWKLTSYVVNDSQDVFNELITKLVQYLSSKEDKRKFKAYPVKNEFGINEKVVFDTEVYNDLYERVYNNKIKLSLKNEQGDVSNYSFITNENNTRYTISDLKAGVYTYSATTSLDGNQVEVNGELVIKDLQIEGINLTADFSLLRSLAKQSGGRFYNYKLLENNQLPTDKLQAQGVIHSSEKYLPVINLKWMFFLLLILASVEWFIRKYSGSY